MSASKQKLAGKASGIRRAKPVKLRRFLVLRAFTRLKPTYQMQPYSTDALDALEEELRKPPCEIGWRSIRSAADLDRPRPSPKPLSSDLANKLESLFDDAFSVLLEKNGLRALGCLATSRETLIKDLKAIGIRSKLRSGTGLIKPPPAHDTA